MGSCRKPRKGPMPYWAGTVTTHDMVATFDVHGEGCAAQPTTQARRSI
jgi:hypothetical protein